MVIYRYAGNNETDTIEKLNTACDRVQSAFITAGLTMERQNETQIHRWLLEWFNPNPSRYFNGLDDKACYDLYHSLRMNLLYHYKTKILVKISFYATGK